MPVFSSRGPSIVFGGELRCFARDFSAYLNYNARGLILNKISQMLFVCARLRAGCETALFSAMDSICHNRAASLSQTSPPATTPKVRLTLENKCFEEIIRPKSPPEELDKHCFPPRVKNLGKFSAQRPGFAGPLGGGCPPGPRKARSYFPSGKLVKASRSMVGRPYFSFASAKARIIKLILRARLRIVCRPSRSLPTSSAVKPWTWFQ